MNVTVFAASFVAAFVGFLCGVWYCRERARRTYCYVPSPWENVVHNCGRHATWHVEGQPWTLIVECPEHGELFRCGDTAS